MASKYVMIVALLVVPAFTFAQYETPLCDEEFCTEVLWNMDAVCDVDKIYDEDNNNPWRNRELRLYNGAALVPSMSGFGNALQFDGVYDYAVSLYNWPKSRTGVVIEVWVYADAANIGDDYIVCSDLWRLYKSGNTLYFRVYDAKGNDASVARSITPNVWKHIRAEFNEGVVSLTVLGGTTGTAISSSDKLTGDSAFVYLGDYSGGGRAFKGKIDDLRITSPPVTSRYERGKNLVEYEFLDVDPYSTTYLGGNEKYIAGWCAAALWLGESNINVTATDITTANTRLDDLDNPAYFTQIPQTGGLDALDGVGLYWALPTLVRIINDPVIYNQTTTAARTSITNVLEGYVSQRDVKSYADVNDASVWTMFGSMNHDWLKRSTFLLASQYFKNNSMNIYADGYTAQEHYDAYVAYLLEKFKQLAARGIDPEIGSGYMSITLESLFNVRDLCENKCLAAQAEKFITLYLADSAAESYHGVRGGGKTRIYKGLDADSPEWAYNPDSSYLVYWTHLLVNDPAVVNGTPNAVLGSAMSDYELPAVVNALMTDVENRNFAHTSRRPAAGTQITEPRDLVYYFAFPSDVRRYTYGNSKFMLGSFAVDDQESIDHYTAVFRQNQWMGLITSGWRYSRAYFQTDSGSYNSHSDLTAVQTGPAMLIKKQEAAMSSYPLFCWLSGDFKKTVVGPDLSTNYWIFAENYTHDVYIAFKAVNAGASSYSITNRTEGVDGSLMVTFTDNDAVIAFEAGQASDYVDFTAFQTAVKDRIFTKTGTEVRYVTLAGRDLKIYTDGSPSKLDDIEYGLNISKTYDGNYLYNISYDSPVINIKDTEGNSLSLNFDYDALYDRADANKDCVVDYGDLCIIAEQWLLCTNERDPRCLHQ